MFSPINRVAYDVEAARVGQRTDYDKLILDVTTNGSIDPKDAIARGCRDPHPPAGDLHRPGEDRGLRRVGRAVADGNGEAAGVSLAGGMENFPIEELELGVRSYNCLKRVGIETIGDLVTKSESELAAIPNFGKKSIEEVKETLRSTASTCAAATARRSSTLRHARSGKKLGRDSAHRKALYSNLAGALIEHGRIKTTVTKAKAVKPIAEQMITLGRRGDLHARRQATAFLRSRDVVHKLFADVAPLFKDRRAGTRGSSSSALARATRRRWPTSSSSTRSTSRAQREERTPEPVAGRPRPPKSCRDRRGAVEEPEAARRTDRRRGRRAGAEARACRRGGGDGSSQRPPTLEHRDDRALRASRAGDDVASDFAKLVPKNRQRITARPTSSNRDDDRRGHDRGVVVRDQERQRVQDPAEERPDAGDRAADRRDSRAPSALLCPRDPRSTPSRSPAPIEVARPAMNACAACG